MPRARRHHLDVTPLPDPAGLAAETSRVYLNLTDIEGTRNPGVVYGVYLNLPADAGEDDREAHRAGVVSFFGIETTDPVTTGATRTARHGMRYSFDVTDLVNRLRSSQDWTPAGPEGDAAAAHAAGAEPPEDQADDLAAGDPEAPRPPAGPVTVGTVSLYQET